MAKKHTKSCSLLLRNANQKHSELSPHAYENAYYQKGKK